MSWKNAGWKRLLSSCESIQKQSYKFVEDSLEVWLELDSRDLEVHHSEYVRDHEVLQEVVGGWGNEVMNDSDIWGLKKNHVVQGRDHGVAGEVLQGVLAAAPTPCLTEITEIEIQLKYQTKWC